MTVAPAQTTVDPVAPASIAAVVDPVAPAVVDPAAPVVDPAITARPDAIPEDLWDAATGAPKYEDIAARLTEHATLKAAQDAAAAERFADVGSVEFAVDLKLPDGNAIEFDKDDPFLQAGAAIAVEHGITKPAFKALLTAFSQSQIEQQLADKAELTAEFTALGDTAAATARVKGVEAFFATAFAADPKHAATAPAKAAALIRTFNKASQIEAVEALMAHFKDPNPGVGGEGGDAASLMQTNPGKVLFGKKAA